MVRTTFKMRFPWVVVLTLGATFLIGGASGAMMYATGTVVAETPKMAMVSHTEYAYSAPGQIIARIVNFQGDPVAVTSCNATILYPNKTAFVNMAGMTATGTIAADFYYAFTTPAGPEGTYEYQATCFYGVNKNASVTNSFHLTPNFNNVLGNLSVILSNQASIQGNITALSAQLNANTSTILAAISDMNSSLYQHITDLNTSINAVSTQVTNIDAALAGNFSVVQSNFTQVLSAINSINMSGANVTVDFTPVLDAITALNVSTQNSFAALNTALDGNFTVVNNKLDVMNVTLNANNAYLVLINATTTDTYNYVTGTLATNVNDVLTNLGIVNATVNRIETTTTQINTTANAILQNQQDAVAMSVFSG